MVFFLKKKRLYQFEGKHISEGESDFLPSMSSPRHVREELSRGSGAVVGLIFFESGSSLNQASGQGTGLFSSQLHCELIMLLYLILNLTSVLLLWTAQ